MIPSEKEIMASLIDTKIASCGSWNDFCELINSQKSSKDKGDLFERLTQAYLKTHPTYRSKLAEVWNCNNGELPPLVQKQLKLPNGDEGIDLVCKTYEGSYWSVQCKFRANSERPLTTKELSKFTSLSFVTAQGIEFGLIVHTSAGKIKKSELLGATTEIGLQHWLAISNEQWESIVKFCTLNTLKLPQRRKKRAHQKKAIKEAKIHFGEKNERAGKLIMPCGTGKSLIAYWIARELKAQTMVIATPSLALVKQSLDDWTAEYLAEGIRPNWIAICSDEDIGKMKDADSNVASVYEAGIPTTTDPNEILKFLTLQSEAPKVIFTTYHSGPKLAEACRRADITLDLLLADEAHKTVGKRDSQFAALISDANIKIAKRLFMTATERVYGQFVANTVSMDDETVYGKLFHKLTFKEAIEAGIICDYKILTVAVAESEIKDLVSNNAEVAAELNSQKIQTDAQSLAAGIAIQKAFAKYPIKHAITFHRTIKRAENFAKQQNTFSGKIVNNLEIRNLNISSKVSAGKRNKILREFVESETSIITNARCLTEGIDVPEIDCVAFVDPKQSMVDIVQAAGRAMRQSKKTGKTHGYILLPIVVPTSQDLSDLLDSADFSAVVRIITHLSTQDDRIVEQLRNRQQGQSTTRDDIIINSTDIIETLNVEYDRFHDAISTRIWNSVGQINFRPFAEARAFVRSLGLKNGKEWKAYSASSERPPDIPSNPQMVYAHSGWKNYVDWYGGEAVAQSEIVYLPFKEARKLVRKLKLKTAKQYFAKFKEGKIPDGIPSTPQKVAFYKDDWVSWGDFLGTGVVAHSKKKFLPFDVARTFCRSLKISSMDEWLAYCRSGARPNDIPANLHKTYGQHEDWLGEADFLGYDRQRIRKKGFWSFTVARIFIRNKKFKNVGELRIARRKGEIPLEVPSSPQTVYAEHWVSWNDWLGTPIPRLTVDLNLTQIKIWMLKWFLDNECWPTIQSGQIPNTNGEKWANINAALNRKGRGIKENTSISKIKSELEKELIVETDNSEFVTLDEKVHSLIAAYHQNLNEEC